MKYRFLLLTVFCFLIACKGGPSDPVKPSLQIITHYNLIIVPDLSNRLERFSYLQDTFIVGSVLHNIYPRIAEYQRSSDQKDCFRVILSATKLGQMYNADYGKMTINLGAFKNQRERIEYLTGRSVHKLKGDSAAFMNEFTRLETAAKQETHGADLWSFMNTGLDTNLYIKDGEPLNYGDMAYQDKTKNILVLLTDGYIEAGIYGTEGCEGKQCRYLSGQLIREFRQAYQKQAAKGETMTAFFKRCGYGIIPVRNPVLRDFEVLVLEVDDRSLGVSGNATVHPTDYEIIELFWKDWMEKSGVKHMEMHPLVRDSREAEQNILSFMNIK